MTLYVFSTLALSIIFMVVFNSWWVENAPFATHLAALYVAASTVLSVFIMIAIYPLLNKHIPKKNKLIKLDKTTWANDVSSNLTTPAAVIDEYNLVFANKAFLIELGMFGMNDQLIGMPITNIIHPSDHQHLAMLFAQTKNSNNEKDSIKLRLLCLDGSVLPAHISLSPLNESENSELRLLQLSSLASLQVDDFVYVDQTSYQQLIHQIEQVVFHLNVNQQIMFLNSPWETMLDYTVQESLNEPLISFVHPEDKLIAESRINSLIQGKHSKSIVEIRLISKNGNSHWVELRAKNTTTYKGERSSVVGTLTDISQMKITEDRLRTNRRLLSTLINNTPGMIYRCKNNREYSFEFVSDGSVDLTGYEPHEMVGNPNFSFMGITHLDDRKMVWDNVQNKVIDQKKFQLIYRIITRSGSIKWVWEHGNGVFSSTGELLALEGIIIEITNQDDTEQDQSEAILAFRNNVIKNISD